MGPHEEEQRQGFQVWFGFLAVPVTEKRINSAENGTWAAGAPTSDG